MNKYFFFPIMLFVLGLTSAAAYYLSGDDFSHDAYMDSPQCQNFKASDGFTVAFQGKSMLPSIQPGDVVLAKKFDPSLPLSVGDIVNAWNVDTGVSTGHRVVSVNSENKSFRMQGDNNHAVDAYVYRYEDIRGVICGVLYR